MMDEMTSFFLRSKVERFNQKMAYFAKVRLILGGTILFFWIVPIFKENLIYPFYQLSFLGVGVFLLAIYFQMRQKDFLIYLNGRLNLEKRSLFFQRKISGMEYKKEDKVDISGYHIPRNSLWEDLDILKEKNLFHFLNITKNLNAGQKIINLLSQEKVSENEVVSNQRKVKFLTQTKGTRKILLTILSEISDKMSLENVTILMQKKLVFKESLKYIIYVYYLFLWFLYLGAAFFEFKPFYILGWIGLLILYALVGLKIKILESYPWVVSFDSQIKRLKNTYKYLNRLSQQSYQEGVPLLLNFQNREKGSEINRGNFSSMIQQLDLISSCLGIRQNFIVYAFVHAFLPWDFFWTLRLEVLKNQLTQLFPQWIEDLSELECYAQIAEFSQNLQHSCWPSWHTEPVSLKAKQVVHPLMDPKIAVPNSIDLEFQKNQLLLITGSNMAGKSTFLRTLAVNQILANMGSRVTASEFVSSPLQVLTSIKRTDSLEDAFSTFYAEVKNLKWILDQCQAQPSIYFIDEIFRGTNNKERLLGSQKYIEKILGTKSIGMVTSHDLELSQMAKENTAIINEHFADRVENGRMYFDYLKKEGPCPSTNALKVMELEGLF
jgi:ABC-type multidrug transport system fused ATPase/permease subunit